MNFSQLMDKGAGKLNSWKGTEPFCPHLLFCLVLLRFPCAILKMLIMSLGRKWCFDLLVGFFSITIKRNTTYFSDWMHVPYSCPANAADQKSSSVWSYLGSAAWEIVPAVCARCCYWNWWWPLPFAQAGHRQYSYLSWGKFFFCRCHSI